MFVGSLLINQCFDGLLLIGQGFCWFVFDWSWGFLCCRLVRVFVGLLLIGQCFVVDWSGYLFVFCELVKILLATN